MVSSHRILFPVDFSRYPFAVSTAVGDFIDRPNVEVILMHVIDADWRASGFARRIHVLDALAHRHFSHCAVRRRLDNGTPADRILEYIRESEVEMVVMPARDSGGFRERPLGRVASSVLREAPCPVWLEWRASAQSTLPAPAARILCAIDAAEPAEDVLRDAAAVAARLGGELTILSPGQPHDNRLDKLRRRIAPGARLLPVSGWNQAVIGQLIREHRPSLLVTGGREPSVLAAEAVCPVLRLPHHTCEGAGLRAGYRRVA
ncbi:MAG TPA: universal stress protein [Bryobacteraceae bacterium]|nr:universal stress protein [Bryobacteraceae bacterium]